MTDEYAPHHQDSLTRFYANHPDELSRAHRAFLGGISDEAQAYMEKHDLPHLAHHPEMENIRNSPKSEHLQRVAELHARESAGPEPDPDSNEGTDGYLKMRIAAIDRGERKASSRREETRLLMTKRNR